MTTTPAQPVLPPPRNLETLSADMTGSGPAAADAAPAVNVTLSEIVTRTVKLPTNARNDSPLNVSVLNLKGLAAIEKKFGSFEAMDRLFLSTESPTAGVLSLITILVNQDRADHDELTEETVGRYIDGTRLPFIRGIIEDMTRPLRGAASESAAKAKDPATTSPAAGVG